MRHLICAFTLVVSALMLAACATTGSVATTADYDRSADFSAYRTFGFAEKLGTQSVPRLPIAGTQPKSARGATWKRAVTRTAERQDC